MTRGRRLLFALLLAGAAAPAPASAQFGAFGTNRIQYRRFDWRILRGAHVDLYHYPEEAELARVALSYAEEAYRALAVRFRHEVPHRIPIIIYASHTDFEQTNLLPFVPPEGLLGFTEFARGRVALPFRGSYAEFRHTIRHELVHAFQLSVGRLSSETHPRVGTILWPLWFSEGLAEYWSAGQDAQDEMLLRDVTLGGRLPTIPQLGLMGGGIVYALGGELVRFLADTYGEWRLLQMYDDAWRYGSFEAALAAVFGRPLDQLAAEWHYAMRRRWYPGLTGQRPLSVSGAPIAPVALKPAVWVPPGDSVPEVLFVSPRSGYTDVYAARLDGSEPRTVVKGERSAQFESFHTFDSRLDVSPDGILVFATRYLARDALVFWDLATQQLVGRYQFPDIVAILSPVWAPDGRSVAFSGLSVAGYSDLYRLALPGGALERLTADRYQDLDPSFSPDGTRLVFASDRTAYGPAGARNLFVMDLATRRLRHLTYGDWQDQSPRWSAADGEERIVFASDRAGVSDVYRVDSLGTGRRESNVPGGVYDPVWVPAIRRFVAGAFEDLRFSIYAIPPLPDSAVEPVALALPDSIPAAWEHGWAWAELDDPQAAQAPIDPYRRRYQLDLVAVDALFVPGAAAAQGATFLLTDQLADQLLYFTLATYQQGAGLGDLVRNFNGAITFMDQSRRLNWGVGVFRYSGQFYEGGTIDQVYRETTSGVVGILRFPLSRFTRVEGRAQVEYSDRLDFSLPAEGIELPRRSGLLVTNSLGYVRDNSLWMPTGPIDGSRMNVTGAIVTDLTNARFDSWMASADLRRYFRTGLYSSIALRGLVFLSGGERPSRVGLGGTWGLRGYPRFSYVTGSRALMLNTEWRFPLTDYLTFGFPFGEARFPGIQGALFGDIGAAWSSFTQRRGALGAYGVGLRMAIVFPLVLRLDVGWRYGSRAGYSLPSDYQQSRFVDFWFGYNY
jgi:Tol biopolymer transport system component